MRATALFLGLPAFLACAACAQPAHEEWLAAAPAAQFRERVVQLALIYGESSGIDPRGYKVVTREIGPNVGGCADVEVVTSNGDEILRRETVRACRAH